MFVFGCLVFLPGLPGSTQKVRSRRRSGGTSDRGGTGGVRFVWIFCLFVCHQGVGFCPPFYIVLFGFFLWVFRGWLSSGGEKFRQQTFAVWKYSGRTWRKYDPFRGKWIPKSFWPSLLWNITLHPGLSLLQKNGFVDSRWQNDDLEFIYL